MNRMKHGSRYVLVFTLVATTLCAERLLASDPAIRLDARQPAEKLVSRLTRSFGQAVRQSPLVVQRQLATPAVTQVAFVSTARLNPVELSAPQYPLPPPQL
jgi:hypothetical protein